jgi:Na+/H+-dicarboxylate symporter
VYVDTKRTASKLAVALVAGISTGWLVYAFASTEQAAYIGDGFSLLSGMFLRLVQMLVAPLILSTLIAGVARAGSGVQMSRLGLRALAWFLCAGLISLALGLVAANILQPGAGFQTHFASKAPSAAPPASALDLETFALHLIPESVFEALADNDILQIVVFSLFAGGALAAMGSKGERLLHACESLGELMLVVTGYVMKLAPLAVFVSMAASVATGGPTVLLSLGKLVGTFYLALLVLWLLMVAVAFGALRRAEATALLRGVREPVMVAFATASSEAAYPAMLAQFERLGVPKSVASFILPLGYSFNLDGSMMYCTFALLFISQAFGVPLSLEQQIGMLLLLMLMSKGMAGVPRSSLVVLTAALPHFQLPEAGLALLIGIDQFLDMGRTATNVFGNSLATAVIARSRT